MRWTPPIDWMTPELRAETLAIAMVAATPALLAGQIRTAPHRPPSRPPAPPIAGGVTTLRPIAHRPLPCRSSVFGLVLFDPYWWMELAPPPDDSRPVGGVQLDVEPRRALVYVDGLLAGVVDDFSGYYHHLPAAAGVHTIEMIAPDYDPLIITVTVAPDRTTTYRGSLNRAAGRH